MFHCISDLDGVREQSHFQAQKNTSTLLMANKWKKVHFGVREVRHLFPSNIYVTSHISIGIRRYPL